MAQIIHMPQLRDGEASPFPASYRHFIEHSLVDLEPWSLLDDKETIAHSPSFDKGLYATKQFKRETGCDFYVYLFARRYDRDDYAFFVVRNGQIEDKVISFHLSFVDKLELAAPLRYEQVQDNFLNWIANVVLEDIAFWIDR